MIRVCKRCGNQFDPASSDTYYCDECRLDIKRESILKIAKCSECGIEFVGGIASKYCPDCRLIKANEASAKSKKNKNRRKIGSLDRCKRCGAEYTVKSGKQKYCSECAEIALAEHNREVSKRKYHENNLYEKQAEQKKALKQDSTICPACGKQFTPNRINQIYCSSECRKIGGKKNRHFVKSGLYAKKTDSERYAEPKSSNKTGIRGVYWDNRLSRYVVKIKIGNQFKRLGSFKNLEEAQEAITKSKYDEQAKIRPTINPYGEKD